MAELLRTRFECLEAFLARRDPELVGVNDDVGHEGRAGRRAALAAEALVHEARFPFDLVLDSSAQAGAVKHGGSLQRRVDVLRSDFGFVHLFFDWISFATSAIKSFVRTINSATADSSTSREPSYSARLRFWCATSKARQRAASQCTV